MHTQILAIIICLAAATYADAQSYIWQDSMQHYYQQDAARALQLADSLLRSRSASADSSETVSILRYRALANRKLGNYVSSIADWKTLYAYHDPTDSLLMAEAADHIGIMYTFMGVMSEGQHYLLKASDIFTEVGSMEQIAGANNGLAIFYNDMHQYELAIEKYDEALAQYIQIKDTLGMANVHANVGLLYLDLGRYDEAEYHIGQQGRLDTLLDTQWGLGFYHDFRGMLLSKRGRLDEALQSFATALQIRETLDSHYNLAESRSSMADILIKLGRHREAITQAEQILKYRAQHQSLTQQQSAYYLLSQAYEQLDLHQQALDYHKLYKTMSDSIYTRDHLHEIANRDALYQKAEQDKKITKLNQANLLSEVKIKNKNSRLWIVSIALGLLAIFSLLLCRLLVKIRHQKRTISKSLQEKEVLMQEIHHRVKNNLQMISSLLTLQSRTITDKAALLAIQQGKTRVRSMAIIHQDLYNKGSLTSVNIHSYLHKLTTDLFSTYKVSEQDIDLHLDIQDINLDIDIVIPLGLIINELITNVLKHAFPDQRAGSMSIKMYEEADHLHLVVKDDGVGHVSHSSDSTSFGKTLIETLTTQLGGSIDIDSRAGVTTSIVFADYKVAD